MKVLTGTSGFSYKGWKGTFYPEDLPASKWLSFYAERFATVEINNTFYRLPSEELLRGWAKQVPADFCFVLKGSRRITHIKRLKDAGDPLEYLLKNVSILGDRLGPLFFQLPPTAKRNLERLNAFLELLPDDRQAAFEFRNATWFDDEVYEALRAKNAALCIADTDDETGFPRVATADWGYMRMRRDTYGIAELEQWATFVRDQEWQRAFVFFKHEDRGDATALAERFRSMFD